MPQRTRGAGRLHRLPMLLLLLLSMATCAARRPELSPPAMVADAAKAGASDRALAITTLEDYLHSKPDPEVEPWALVWAGEQRRLSGDNAAARTWFETAAERYPTHPTKEAAVLGMALVDSDTSLSGNTLATMQLVGDQAVPDTMNADRYRLLARVAADEGSANNKVREMARRSLAYAAADPTVDARVRGSLSDLLPSTDAQPAPAASADVEALNRLRSTLKARDYDGAAEQGKRFAAAFPDSPLAPTAAGLTRRAAARDPVVANRVGVLLPLTGEFAPPAARLKEVISWTNDREGSPLELVFADTAGDPAKAVAELDKLVLEKGCVTVVGPLLRTEAEAAALEAQHLEVPLVALTQSGAAVGTGDYVFNAYVTIEQQVDALSRYAISRRNLTTFAVLYPKNAYGENAADLFEAAVVRAGGTVVKKQGYEPDSKDFLDTARRLGDKDFKAQSAELARLRREAEKAGGDPSKVTLPPNIGFQALFIPDNVQRTSLVVSALAYEEFPVGTFKPRRGDIPLVLLGLNGWNSADLARTGGSYMRNSLFVDAFFVDDPAAASFVSSYSSALERKPMVLDALAWDATRLIVAAAKKSAADRVKMRDNLTSVSITGPMSGSAEFGADRSLDHDLRVLTLTSRGIEPATEPDPSEDPTLNAPQ